MVAKASHKWHIRSPKGTGYWPCKSTESGSRVYHTDGATRDQTSQDCKQANTYWWWEWPGNEATGLARALSLVQESITLMALHVTRSPRTVSEQIRTGGGNGLGMRLLA